MEYLAATLTDTAISAPPEAWRLLVDIVCACDELGNVIWTRSDQERHRAHVETLEGWVQDFLDCGVLVKRWSFAKENHRNVHLVLNVGRYQGATTQPAGAESSEKESVL